MPQHSHRSVAAHEILVDVLRRRRDVEDVPICKAHVGAQNRAAITKLEAKWKLQNTNTIRRIVALGLGDTMPTADAINTEMKRRRLEAQAAHGRLREPGPKEQARAALGKEASPRNPTISVRLPSVLSKRVAAGGGPRSVVERGIAVAHQR
jgi:hypothetical protein